MANMTAGTLPGQFDGSPSFDPTAWLNAAMGERALASAPSPLPADHARYGARTQFNAAAVASLLERIECEMDARAALLERRLVEAADGVVARAQTNVEAIRAEARVVGASLHSTLQSMDGKDLSSTNEMKQISSSSANLSSLSMDAKNLSSSSTTTHDTLQTTEISATLRRLHAVKVRMEEAARLLRETSKWSTLEANVDGWLADGVHNISSLETAVDHVAESLASLAMFQGTSDYDRRASVLAVCVNRVHAALGSRLHRAVVVDREHETVKLLHALYRRIVGQGDTAQERFQRDYAHALAGCVQAQWTEAISGARPSATPAFTAQSLPALERFLGDLFLIVRQEAAWNHAVLEDAGSEANLGLVTNVVEELSPPWSSILNATITTAGPASGDLDLPTAVAVLECVDRFLMRVERIPSAGSHDDHTSGVEAKHTIFAPFLPLLADYSELERRWLTTELGTLFTGSRHGAETTVTSLQEKVAEAFRRFDAAIGRCGIVTRFSRPAIMLTAVSGALESFVEQLADTASSTVAKRQPKQVLERNSSVDALDSALQGDSGNDQWTVFQHVQDLLAACNAVEDRSNRLNKTIQQCRCVDNASSPSSSRLWSAIVTEWAATTTTNGGVDNSPLSPSLNSIVLGRVLFIGLVAQHALFCSFFQPMYLVLSTFRESFLETFIGEDDSQRPVAAYHGLELPAFSVSAGTYVREIGEYLLALPQQLGLFLIDKDPAVVAQLQYLSSGLSLIATLPFNEPFPSWIAMKSRVLKLATIAAAADKLGSPDPADIAHRWINALCGAVACQYFQETLRLPRGKVSLHGCRQIRADVEYLENIFRALELGDEQGGAATEHDGSALSRLHLLQLLVVEFSATSKTTAEGRRLLQTTLDRVAASPIGEAGVVTAGEALANNSTVIVSQIVQLLATNAELRTAYDDVMRLLLG